MTTVMSYVYVIMLQSLPSPHAHLSYSPELQAPPPPQGKWTLLLTFFLYLYSPHLVTQQVRDWFIQRRSKHPNKSLTGREISGDSAFVSQECDRLETLLAQASRKWGNKEDNIRAIDVWRDIARSSDRGARPSDTPSKSGGSPRKGQASTGKPTTVLGWLRAGGKSQD